MLDGGRIKRQNEDTKTCTLCASFKRPGTWTLGGTYANWIKTGGPPQDLGLPTQIQSMKDKLAAKARSDARAQGAQAPEQDNNFEVLENVPFMLEIEKFFLADDAGEDV